MEGCGIHPKVAAAYAQNGITSLFPWQRECLQVIRDDSSQRMNLVYSAPTGAGKTLVAEILMLETVMVKRKKALLVLPYVSIVVEKVESFSQIFGKNLGIRIKGLYQEKKVSDVTPMTNIVICTIEKANSLVNKYICDGKLDQVGCIVFDEMHLIGDSQRGVVIELLLTKLRFFQVYHNFQMQLVGMSATLPNLEKLSNWLDAKLYVSILRPVDLKEFLVVEDTALVYDSQGNSIRTIQIPDKFLKFFGKRLSILLQLILETVQAKGSVILFCSSRKKCEHFAAQIAKCLMNIRGSEFDIMIPDDQIIEERQNILEKLKITPFGLDNVLAQTISVGVSYHHAGLSVEERKLIENGFRCNAISILTATSTLAAGVNLPARRVLFPEAAVGTIYLPTTQYRQMAGRAGRPGSDNIGESFLIVQSDKKKGALTMMNETLASITSKLFDGDNIEGIKRLLIEGISSLMVQSTEEIESLVMATWCACELRTDILAAHTKRALKYLLESNFLEFNAAQKRFTATSLGLASFSSCIQTDQSLIAFEVLDKARDIIFLTGDIHLLYLITPVEGLISPSWSRYFCIIQSLSEDDLLIAKHLQIDSDFILQASNLEEKRHQLKRFEERNKELMNIHTRFWNALILNELLNGEEYSTISTKFLIDRGAIQSIQVLASTYAGMVANFCEKLNWWDLNILFSEYAERLAFGVAGEWLPLMQIPDMDRLLARILYQTGYQSIASIANSNEETLSKLLLRQPCKPFSRDKEGDEVSSRLLSLPPHKIAQYLVLSSKEICNHKTNGEESFDQVASDVPGISVVQLDGSAENHQQLENSWNQSSQFSFLCVISIRNDSRGAFTKHITLKDIVSIHDVSLDKMLFCFDSTKVYVVNDLSNIQNMEVVSHILGSDEAKTKVCSNMSFFLQILRSAGIDVKGQLKDPAVAHWLINSDSNASFDLNYLFDSYFHGNDSTQFNFTDIKGDSDPISLILKEKMLMDKLDVLIDGQNLRDVFILQEMQVAKILSEIEWNGVGFNKSKLFSHSVETNLKINFLRELVNIYAGRKVDLDSPSDCAKFIFQDLKLEFSRDDFDEISSDSISMQSNKEILQVVSENNEHPASRVINEFRALRRFQTFYFKQLPTRCVWNESMNMYRIHSTLKQGGTATGRIVASFPSLQILTKEIVFKPLARHSLDFEIKHQRKTGPYLLPCANCSLEDSQREVRFQITDSSHDGILLEIVDSNGRTIDSVDLILKMIDCNSLFGKIRLLLSSKKTGDFETKLIPLDRIWRRVAVIDAAVLTNQDFATQKSIIFGDGLSNQFIPWKTVQFKVRDSIVSQYGFKILAADFKQIEARLMAHFSGDRNLLDIICSGGDIIKKIASFWLQKSEDLVDSNERQMAKGILYGVLYGQGAQSLSLKLKCSKAEAQTFLNSFHDRFPAIKNFIESFVARCKQQGYVQTLSGRRRFLPDLHETDVKKRTYAERQCINTLCQGSAADLMKQSLISIHKETEIFNKLSKSPKMSCKIIMLMHDEFIFEVPREAEFEFSKIVKRTMEITPPNFRLIVPMEARVSSGYSWGSLTEIQLE